MKRLFLTSTFASVSDGLLRLCEKSPNELTVAFIPTAGDVYEDAWFVESDKKELVRMGFKLIEVSLKDLHKEQLHSVLVGVDIIFVAGGNTFYLLDKARESGFLEIVTELVNDGTVYVGSSAGSYLACPTIEVASWKHQDKNIVGLTNLQALGLVPFLLSVHYQPQYAEALKNGISHTKLPFRILTDQQALIIHDNTVELYGDSAVVTLELSDAK